MISLAVLNFDIIAIVFLITFAIMGYYYGAYRELKRLIGLVLTLVIGSFIISPILNKISTTTFYESIMNFLKDKLKIDVYVKLIFTLILLFILYFLIYLVIMFILSFFKYDYMGTQKKSMRFVGSIISIFKTYIYLVLLFSGLSLFGIVRFDTPLVKASSVFDNRVYDISLLDRVLYRDYTEYENIETTYEEITGESIKKGYDYIQEILKETKKVKDYFTNDFITKVSEENKDLFKTDDPFNLRNIRKIIRKEKDNPNIEEFNTMYENLKEYEDYLNYVDGLIDKDYQTFGNYFIDNFEEMKWNSGEAYSHAKALYDSYKFYQIDFSRVYTITDFNINQLDDNIKQAKDILADTKNHEAIKTSLSQSEEQCALDFVKVLESIDYEKFNSYKVKDFVSKVIFTYENRLLFSRNTFQHSSLLRALVNDSIASTECKGNKLMLEYLTQRYYYDSSIEELTYLSETNMQILSAYKQSNYGGE